MINYTPLSLGDDGNFFARSKPDPDIVAERILETFERDRNPLLPVTGKSRAIQIGWFNACYANHASGKAEYFKKAYQYMMERVDICGFAEVDPGFIEDVAGYCGMGFRFGTPNGRAQGMGMLLNNRWIIVDWEQHWDITGVLGKQYLRPALSVSLVCKTTALIVKVVFIHLKSMIGGAYATGAIRYMQAEKLVQAMKIRNQFALIVGDFNAFLDHTSDLDPLYRAGFRLQNPKDNTPTQNQGKRIDGCFHINKPEHVQLGWYGVRNWWRDPLITPAFSDHGFLTWKMVVGAFPDDTFPPSRSSRK